MYVCVYIYVLVSKPQNSSTKAFQETSAVSAPFDVYCF